jgi:hypothetical protein
MDKNKETDERKENPDKDLYVNISAPTELRRYILESSKAIINVLKNYHKLAATRDEKNKLLATLKIQVNEITLLTNKLKDYIPQYTLAIEKEKLKKHIHDDKKPFKKLKPKQSQNISEIDQLQAELNKIEQKLNVLK